ncbi:MAG: protein-L-isoaspartate(D-aspartate) O-methyltransferase [Hyphomicrobiaceae bacterium]|nr:protein-L-isoaspartate(D-aspartate) O-methyltransferase [Hyphomicrobiaceae bacterium]MCC0011307.1 protein-L-isoaspartate(D-aspartate) O-methyltransferase [Hyphomicrobiaceae bacterium]
MVSPKTAFSHDRIELAERIKAEAGELPRALGDAISWPGVIDRIGSIPRENFINPNDLALAYKNAPLSIGFGQTISQPLIVALMSGLLQPTGMHNVLEVGTGSGYQAAVLAGLVASVHSIEIVPQLAARARQALASCGIENVKVYVGNGHAGLPAQAPFDGIIVTAASEFLPETLFDQLKPGGRMVLPLGSERQTLSVVTKQAEGADPSVQALLPVRFVPFVA